jgi:hypothetical protein
MAPVHSVTCWLEQLKQGDRQAAQPLWERCFISHLGEKELTP